MYKISLEHFEGPLDLLLELIESQKMDISTVSLSKVAEQFLEYLSVADDMRPEELADFLVVAAKLLLIKSRILLPSFTDGDDDEIDLEKQLKMYKQYYDASKVIHQMILKQRYSFARSSLRTVRMTEKKFRAPEHLDTEGLKHHMLLVLKRLEPFFTIPDEVITKTVNIRERIDDIRKQILSAASVNFQSLLEQADSKTDIIITFLALLELVKQRTIVVVQDDAFSNIHIQRREEEQLLNEEA